MTTHAIWTNIDHYIEDRLLAPDPMLDAALETSRAAGLPPIHVAPNQGKLLQLLALAIGARRILEIGTLGGYSTIWLARALPFDGRLVTLEIDARHAEVARANLARCGLADKVEVRVGRAIDTLAELPPDPPFDLVFIDADKPSNPDYLDAALRLTRPGSLIVVDNVVREGGVLDAQGDAAVQGARKLFDRLGSEARVAATALQTVGCKGHDGFAIALVLSVEEPMQSEPE
jgi:predicted O-methyltransferase YrrM